MNYSQDFINYATKHLNINSMQLHYWEKLQDKLYGPNASLTPYITEESDRRSIQMDIFSRMQMERIIWVAGVVNDNMSVVTTAQLMWLDTQGNEDITMHIDTPGGSTKSGKSMIDVMNYVSSDIITINTGMAASMGSVLLGAGTKGKRYSLPSSKVMLHQVSAGTEGNIQDMRISLLEAEKENESLFKLLGDYCDKDPEQVKQDATRDFWMNAQEAVEYGIIDSVIKNKQ
jgi:ATP-dependent Clp protease, protease subunit